MEFLLDLRGEKCQEKEVPNNTKKCERGAERRKNKLLYRERGREARDRSHRIRNAFVSLKRKRRIGW